MKYKVLTRERSVREVDVPEGSTVLDTITAAGASKNTAFTRHLNGVPCFGSDLVGRRRG